MKRTVKWTTMRRIWRTDWLCHKTPRSLWKRPDSDESFSDVGLDFAGLVGSVVDSALVGSVADFAVGSVADFAVDSVAEDSVAEDSVAVDSVAAESVAADSVAVDSVAEGSVEVESEEDAVVGAEFAAEQQT